MISQANSRYLLAIESATSICSVALFQNDQLLGEVSKFSPRSHNEKLAIIAAELLRQNGVEFNQVSNIAVSIGPGSFTGLRVGLSYAKGIALGNGCKIIPIDTLKALALTVYQQGKNTGFDNSHEVNIVAATVARKSESFAGTYKLNSNSGYPDRIGEITLICEQDLSNKKILNNCLAGGEGFDNLILNSNICENETWRLVSNVKASATSVGYLALKSVKEKYELDDTMSFEPMYINEFTVHK